MGKSRRTANTIGCPRRVVFAPDGSRILEFLETAGASLVRCELPAGAVSLAVRHRTIEELWYFVEARGEVWRRYPDQCEEVSAVGPQTCLRIPTGAAFQFRNTGAGALAFLIVTLPPWPGAEEAVRVADHWPRGPGANGTS